MIKDEISSTWTSTKQIELLIKLAKDKLKQLINK